MSTADEIYLMLFAEIPDDSWSENIRHTTLVLRPTRYFVGVGPEQVAEKTDIGRVLWLLDVVDLRQVDQVG